MTDLYHKNQWKVVACITWFEPEHFDSQAEALQASHASAVIIKLGDIWSELESY